TSSSDKCRLLRIGKLRRTVVVLSGLNNQVDIIYVVCCLQKEGGAFHVFSCWCGKNSKIFLFRMILNKVFCFIFVSNIVSPKTHLLFYLKLICHVSNLKAPKHVHKQL